MSVSDASTTGFTLTGTNWLPGSDIYVYVEDPDGNQVFFDDDGFFLAQDVLGHPFTTFEVTAAAALAATGASESGPYFAGAAGVLALLGLTAIVVSRRRMKQI